MHAYGEIEHVLNYTVAVDIRGITPCLLAVAHVARSAALIATAMHLSAPNEITRVTSFTESILSMCSESAGRGSANTTVRFRPEERVRKCKPFGAHVRLTQATHTGEWKPNLPETKLAGPISQDDSFG